MDYLLDLLYPPTCLSCGELLIPGSKVPLCPRCHGKWEELRRERCRKCKQPQTLCACMTDLLSKHRSNIECVHLVPYREESVAGKLILRAKDERLVHLTEFFADQLEAVLAVRGISAETNHLVLTYLPRSRDRANETGVDQSRAIAKALSKRLGVPAEKCFARKNAPPQKNLNVIERLLSARETYRLAKRCPSVKGATVLLIDDILTSGATMLAGCELLLAAGAENIYCVSVGKTMDYSVQDE